MFKDQRKYLFFFVGLVFCFLFILPIYASLLGYRGSKWPGTEFPFQYQNWRLEVMEVLRWTKTVFRKRVNEGEGECGGESSG